MKKWKETCFDKPVDLYYAYHRRNLKNFLMNLFKWEGLPETINEAFLNDSVLFRGFTVGFKYTDGNVYVTDGAISGLTEYYYPTKFKAANIKFAGIKRTIGKDCEVCFNTYDYQTPYSLSMMVDIYARRLAELDVSVDTSIKNSRVCMVATVTDEKDAIRTQGIINKMYDGEPAVFAYRSNAFNNTEGIGIYPIKSKDNIVVQELADARRNIMADFYKELGIDTLAVDKKERTNLMEMESNDQQLAIAGEVFLKPRQEWCERMNAMFGLNMSVDFNMNMIKENVYAESTPETGTDNEA